MLTEVAGVVSCVDEPLESRPRDEMRRFGSKNPPGSKNKLECLSRQFFFKFVWFMSTSTHSLNNSQQNILILMSVVFLLLLCRHASWRSM
jgi:hypothetical protein